jgi:RimJ/RimL family protein N-acetyltransferase
METGVATDYSDASAQNRLSDGVVSLREIAPGDAEFLYQVRMDPLSRPMFRNVELVPYESHERMVRKYFETRSGDRWFLIEAGGKAVGTISLYGFEDEGRRCEWGRFVIAPEWRKSGLGRRALRLLLDYARSVGVERAHCEVLAGNTAAQRLYQEAGFVQTGESDYHGRTFLELSCDL